MFSDCFLCIFSVSSLTPFKQNTYDLFTQKNTAHVYTNARTTPWIPVRLTILKEFVFAVWWGHKIHVGPSTGSKRPLLPLLPKALPQMRDSSRQRCLRHSFWTPIPVLRHPCQLHPWPSVSWRIKNSKPYKAAKRSYLGLKETLSSLPSFHLATVWWVRVQEDR